MKIQDYYEVLGVARSASFDEIKRQYRKLALEYHPDRNPDAAAGEQFRVITEAYECLSNPEKRAVYDKTLNEVLNSFVTFQNRPQPPANQPSSWGEVLGKILLVGLAAYAFTSPQPKKRRKPIRKRRKGY